MLERGYQAKLITKIETLFPGALVLKNDPNYIQGIPDLTILYQNRWALLEVKASAGARHRPNQDYYISKADEMSFASFIFPENEDEVFLKLEEHFQA